MTEAKYLKIISDLFRLTGYAHGIMSGMTWEMNSEEAAEKIEDTLKYLEEQQNLILMQLDEDK